MKMSIDLRFFPRQTRLTRKNKFQCKNKFYLSFKNHGLYRIFKISPNTHMPKSKVKFIKLFSFVSSSSYMSLGICKNKFHRRAAKFSCFPKTIPKCQFHLPRGYKFLIELNAITN